MCDESLAAKITICSVVTFIFSLASIYWLWFSAFNKSCLDDFSQFLFVWSGFIPLPVCAIYLHYECKKYLSSLHQQIEELKQECMASH